MGAFKEKYLNNLTQEEQDEITGFDKIELGKNDLSETKNLETKKLDLETKILTYYIHKSMECGELTLIEAQKLRRDNEVCKMWLLEDMWINL